MSPGNARLPIPKLGSHNAQSKQRPHDQSRLAKEKSRIIYLTQLHSDPYYTTHEPPYKWWAEEPSDSPIEDCGMTIGIGVVCEAGKCVVMASDKRGSYGDPKTEPDATSPNDRTGKQFDFHPLKLVASVAGRLSVAHDLVSQLTVEMDKLVKRHEAGKPIYREHVENAINRTRAREMRRTYDWACRINFGGITLNQLHTGKLPYGKLDETVWKEVARSIFDLPLRAEMIISGFLDNEPLLLKASGKLRIEGDADPPLCVIGSKGKVLALDHLSKRGQHIFTSLPQTLLHVHEAIELARSDDHFVGPCDGYIVMLQDFEGMWIIRHRDPLLVGWAKAFKESRSTEKLGDDIFRAQARGVLRRIPPGPRFVRAKKAGVN